MDDIGMPAGEKGEPAGAQGSVRVGPSDDTPSPAALEEINRKLDVIVSALEAKERE